jgi:hypothetical protein
MENSSFFTSRRWRNSLFLLSLAALTAASPRHASRYEQNAQKEPDALPASEFSRLIQDFSEPDGYFRSDNFTSNETSYLHVIDKLHELEVSGGAYIGVGPEQNFTYIAKIRPRIAFIVDIRRQAAIQHLLYKAIFHQAETRAQFLADLLCRPLSGDKQPSRAASISELVDYFAGTPASNEIYIRNLARVKKTIQEDFHCPLNDRDQSRLEYVYSAFRDRGLNVSFQFGSFGRPGYGGFPTLGDLVLETDLQGRLGNFLASDDDYRFVRHLQELNRIIPITGDFAGPKALASIGAYLKQKDYTVSAFYTSNVEQFLFQNGVFGNFVANVRKLPIDDKSVFIRAVARMRQASHPAYQPGHRTVTLLQKIPVFLHDQDTSLYPSYWDLVTTHYIAGQKRWSLFGN